MNQLEWIMSAFAAERLAGSIEFDALLSNGKRHQPPFYFLTAADGAEETSSMHRQFPARQVIAFARRQDDDAVVCVVLADRSIDRGQVVIVHDDAVGGHEVDREFASIAEWAKAARKEIAERAREGWNESIKDLLD